MYEYVNNRYYINSLNILNKVFKIVFKKFYGIMFF